MHELVDHTADLEVRIVSPTLAGVFADAGNALFEIVAGDLEQIVPRRRHVFAIPPADPPDMLHEWLTALLAAFEIERMLFRDFGTRVRAGRLTATARGEPFDAARHRLAHEVKAVTRHRLTAHATAHGWEATFVVDI
jgi:SHS2 domain-containing protein